MAKKRTQSPRKLDQAFLAKLTEDAVLRCDVGYIRNWLHKQESGPVDLELVRVANRDHAYDPETPTGLRARTNRLEHIHNEQREHEEETQGDRYEHDYMQYLESNFLGMFEGKRPVSFVDACDQLVDLIVQSAILEGADPAAFGYTQRFLKELRRGYAEVDSSIETMAALKRVEDKVAIGQEGYERIVSRLEQQHGVTNFFDLAMKEAEQLYQDAPHMSEDDKTEFASERAQDMYVGMLNGLGLDNARNGECSAYSIALLQRAEHAAQAEFMRLPKENETRKATPLSTYVKDRAPVLLKEALAKYPPLDLGPGAPDDICTHEANALHAAVKWLQAMQRSTGQGMAR